MIIDFHTHIFPDKIAARSIESLAKVSGVPAATNGTLDGLLKSMERTGVDLSVIMPVVTKPAQFESVNTFAAMVNEQYAGKLLSFGGIHPDSADYRAELDLIKKLVLAHMGGWRQWEEVCEYLAGLPVYFDTAFCFDYMEQEMFMKLYEKHDRDKILFGTDSPWSGAAEDIAAVNNLPISASEREAIFSGNARKILNI